MLQPQVKLNSGSLWKEMSYHCFTCKDDLYLIIIKILCDCLMLNRTIHFFIKELATWKGFI